MTVIAKAYTLTRIDTETLHAEIMSQDPLPTATYEGLRQTDDTHVDVLSTIVPTSQELTDLDAAVDDHALKGARAAKSRAIDRRTQELIRVGFAYSGKTFSLSLRAQHRLNSLGTQLGSDLLIEPGDFPIRISQKSNAVAAYAVTDIADMEGLLDAYARKIHEHYDSGRVLKKAVRDANTVAEVDAVVDGR